MHIKATVKEINQENAILKCEDGKLINWPADRLPTDCKIGENITISLKISGQDKEPKQLAKDLLNEILNIE